MKFRKKPVVIEAIKYTGENSDEIIKFTNGEASMNSILPILSINTLEGIMEISEGDWIIKGVKGEFYPCKPDIFEETYEKVD